MTRAREAIKVPSLLMKQLNILKNKTTGDFIVWVIDKLEQSECRVAGELSGLLNQAQALLGVRAVYAIYAAYAASREIKSKNLKIWKQNSTRLVSFNASEIKIENVRGRSQTP